MDAVVASGEVRMGRADGPVVSKKEEKEKTLARSGQHEQSSG